MGELHCELSGVGRGRCLSRFLKAFALFSFLALGIRAVIPGAVSVAVSLFPTP